MDNTVDHNCPRCGQAPQTLQHWLDCMPRHSASTSRGPSAAAEFLVDIEATSLITRVVVVRGTINNNKGQTFGVGHHRARYTYAESHLQDTACRPGAAADKAAANKSSKYCDLAGTHLFFPVAIETAGTWNQMAVELLQEIGRRITLVTEDSRETVFLFQRLSIALQRGNAVSFLSTFTATD